MHEVQQDITAEVQAIQPDSTDAKAAEGSSKPSSATQALALAREIATFGVDANQQTWAFMREGANSTVCLISSQAFADSLSYHFYRKHDKALGSSACSEAISVLQAAARFEGESVEVHLRSKCPADENRLVLDLADSGDQVVVVDATGWQVSGRRSCGVHFHRPQGVLPLPIPVANSTQDFQRLGQYVCLEDPGQLPLLVVTMAYMLVGRGPFPVVTLQGDPGSGKSEAARRIRGVIDPSTVPLQSIFASERDVVIACTNSKIIALDNMREMKPAVSDILCRIATGGGLRTRKLGTDKNEQLFNIAAPVILTGIEDLTTQPDLADRSLVFRCQRIATTERRTQQDLVAAFAEDAPFILGMLLDIIAGAWRELPTLQVSELPRMADFARFGLAAAKHMGLPDNAFSQLFKKAQFDATSGVRAQDLVLENLINMFAGSEKAWEGTTHLLLEKLNEQVGAASKNKSWPRNALAMGKRLSSIRPALEAHDIHFEVFSSGGRKLRIWTEQTTEVAEIEQVGCSKHTAPHETRSIDTRISAFRVVLD
ncbi:hypothetical protein [Aeromonas media]|uniref:hypothetical protein n=1 Tax=Aeromonas media TaxID=651 RepID=UPI0015FD9268|nr:hypothetical protein [Aeromonas media]